MTFLTAKKLIKAKKEREMLTIIIGIEIFILTLILLERSVHFVLNRVAARKEVQKRAEKSSSLQNEAQIVDIIRKTSTSDIPWFDRVLLSFHWVDKVRHLLEQADIRTPLAVFVLLSAMFFSVVLAIGTWLRLNILLIIPVAVVAGTLPFLYIHFKKKRRLEKFQKQLPNCLDLIARALKAGHAFTSGMSMVAEEMENPIKTEFSKTLNEIKFGVSVPDALKNLSARLDCTDLKFFVISVIIQRDTGGNLAEILEKITHVIRERFKLQGHVKALSAEGKLSAIILVLIPFVIAGAISILNPGYMKSLVTDPIGKVLIVFGFSMMVIGVIFIKRMIQIKA